MAAKPDTELTERLLAVLGKHTGLRPATPAGRPSTAWVPWDLDSLAVDIGVDLVEVRVVAMALPLPPLLHRAQRALRAVLDESAWSTAVLRLVVTDIDAAAVNGPETHPKLDEGESMIHP
ncbi:MAG TPA: hypothetical protein VHX38_07660 [Pseudonocardiaceae bacterium]|nr:hypothetical protein [Pseudonocardiaceae bacterium]